MAHRGEDLYEQHAQLVYRYLFSLCRDADLAEELCQETFCQALRQLGSFRGDCTPQQLDPDTREVIHLRLAGDFSFRDIGDILDRSEVWARVRFYRGKEELARIMGGDRDGT